MNVKEKTNDLQMRLRQHNLEIQTNLQINEIKSRKTSFNFKNGIDNQLEQKFDNFNKQMTIYRQKLVNGQGKKDHVTKILEKLDFNLLNEVKNSLIHLKSYQCQISLREFFKMCNPKSSQFLDDNLLDQQSKNLLDYNLIQVNIGEILHKLNLIKCSRKNINGDNFHLNQNDNLDQLIKTSLWKQNLTIQQTQSAKKEQKFDKPINKIQKYPNKYQNSKQYSIQEINNYLDIIQNSGKQISQSQLQQIIFDSQDRKNSSPSKLNPFQLISTQEKGKQSINILKLNEKIRIKTQYINGKQIKNLRSQSHHHQKISQSVETSPLLQINKFYDSDDEKQFSKNIRIKSINQNQNPQIQQQYQQRAEQQSELQKDSESQILFKQQIVARKLNQQQLQDQQQQSIIDNNNKKQSLIKDNYNKQYIQQQNVQLEKQLDKKQQSYGKISAWENDQFQDEEW